MNVARGTFILEELGHFGGHNKGKSLANLGHHMPSWCWKSQLTSGYHRTQAILVAEEEGGPYTRKSPTFVRNSSRTEDDIESVPRR